MFAALLLPNFRLQAALRHRGELWPEPVAIVDDTQNDGTILDLTPAAATAGIALGATSTQAMARCSQIRLFPRARAQEQTAAAALLEIAGTLSPEIEATADGVCTADLRNAKTENWQPLAYAAIARLAALDLRAHVGIAANPDLALLAAHHAKPVLVVQEPRAFLTGLAISEIEPPRELLAILREWGITNLGDLARLPKSGLVERLGPAAGELWQRAAGGAPRLLRLVRPAEKFSETFDFEHEIETTEPLLFILRRFLDQLSLRLRSAYRVAGKMTLTLSGNTGFQPVRTAGFQPAVPPPSHAQTPSSPPALHQRHFIIPAPTADPEILFRILHTHLENLHLEQRPIGIRLTFEPALASDQQLRLFDSPLRDPNRFGETLARIVALVGGENAGVAQLADTHRPDCFKLVEPRFADLDCEPANPPRKNSEPAKSPRKNVPLAREPASVFHLSPSLWRGRGEGEGSHRTCIVQQSETPPQPASTQHPQPAADLALGLPLRRFRPPFSAQVQLTRHIPSFIFSEKIHGEIIDAAGPYRLSGDWWDREKWDTEEWDIELPDGSLFRISRQRDSWFIEGSYDAAPEGESAPANLVEAALSALR